MEVAYIDKLIADYDSKDFNEANTRFKIIDEIFTNVLKWPKTMISCEDCINDTGYSDYLLKKNEYSTYLVVEAKKEGVSFSIPKNYLKDRYSFISMETLLTDKNILKTVNQVRAYCVEIGCEFACITNGNEWIFFKCFERNKNWKKLKALTIPNLTCFGKNFTSLYNILSYDALKDGSLAKNIGVSKKGKRDLFFPKKTIHAYDEKIDANNYSRFFRPLTSRYFKDLDVNDSNFMDNCYVEDRSIVQSQEDLQSIIIDSISPYFVNEGIVDAEGEEGNIKFINRLHKNRTTDRAEVIVLFGGKGAGKSTFLKTSVFHKPPKILENSCKASIIDLLKTPEDKESIKTAIWNKLIDELDEFKLLNESREQLTKLYEDLFIVSKKQELYGLPEDSEVYNLRLNDLISKWKVDYKTTSIALKKFWKSRHKGLVIIIDNTDQFPQDLQDYCFTTAQEIADHLKCLVVISMREERYYKSKIHGTLDAYQNSGFHIKSPITSKVFDKRINYILRNLNSDDFCLDLFGHVNYNTEHVEATRKFFRILGAEFSDDKSTLNNFLTASAHGDTRKALDLFREFIISGYTNVDEMVGVSGLWKIRVHQVLKPIMMPNRFFYDEEQSNILNIFRVRDESNGSHFTGLRILNKLIDGSDSYNPKYHSIAFLKDHFGSVYGIDQDFTRNLDYLLKYDLIESDNRIDYYSDDVDKIKITNFGYYVYNDLSKYFTYLELISSDVGFFSQKYSNEISELSNKDYRLFKAYSRAERVLARIQKAETFLEYLKEEETEELNIFGNNLPSFVDEIKQSFDTEIIVVKRSASRNN
ncbi:hypothetical protein [Pectobacterium carotovorum]|uniref:hypothetical protein n=1 Tax=Pectobacterium carotovorum TaxID=554 RepID=UPI0020825BFF|nr:hypothetical protein [Pectobacterium carotovorum]GKW37279.1 hypothetical protein PEC301875_13030 [Pectobacterium carotovorum subsp. carotovorum]